MENENYTPAAKLTDGELHAWHELTGDAWNTEERIRLRYYAQPLFASETRVRFRALTQELFSDDETSAMDAMTAYYPN